MPHRRCRRPVRYPHSGCSGGGQTGWSAPKSYFQLATRVLAENGANVVKSYYCDGFERVAAACPVPIVIAGGKKLPELEALEMAYRAIAEGARGVDMGRNIFQSDCPAGMAQAIGKVVHGGYTAQQAFEVYQEIKNRLIRRELSCPLSICTLVSPSPTKSPA